MSNTKADSKGSLMEVSLEQMGSLTKESQSCMGRKNF